jgi:putative SOS response-associated peptidase YedK
MCGRYASARKRIELLEEFRVERDRVGEPLQPDYNVAPTKPVYAVLTHGSRPAGGNQADAAAASGAAREMRVVRWGLVPSWAKDRSIASRLINARAETVASKPAFRRAFAHRRCLLPADGYYEWQRADAGHGGVKQPYFICRGDERPLAFAGLYELWRDPQGSERSRGGAGARAPEGTELPQDDERPWLWTATIITTSAPDDLGRIHDRMPMVVQPDRWSDWLDPEGDDPADLMPLLAPAASAGLISYPVSTTVNSVRNNGPRLIERI